MENNIKNPFLKEILKLILTKLLVVYIIVLVSIISIVSVVESNSSNYITYNILKHNLEEITNYPEEPLHNTQVLLNNCLLANCTFLSVSDVKNRYFFELNKSQDKEYNLIFIGKESYSGVDLIIHDTSIFPIYAYKNITFYANKNLMSNVIKITLEHITLFLCIIWTLLYIIGGTLFIKYKNRERFINTKIVADSVQKELSESLHHEINSPLTVIKVIGLNTQDTLGTYLNTSEKDFKKNNLGKDIVYLKVPKQSIENLYQDFSLFKETVERIEGTISILGKSKHIRGGENYTINKIVDNFKSVKLIMQTVKPIFRIIKLKQDKMPYTPELNIVITNILDTLVNNSLEAGATTISIYPSQTLQEYDRKQCVFLYVEDDGGGIKDKDGNLCPDLDIFKYGFSTKDKLSTRKANFFTKVFGLDTEITNTRGIGLNVNREAIRGYGGELSLFKTNRAGTIFQIIIPVNVSFSNKEESLYGNL